MFVMLCLSVFGSKGLSCVSCSEGNEVHESGDSADPECIAPPQHQLRVDVV